MRNVRFVALLAPGLLLTLAPLACESSSSPSVGTFNPEAGPGFEAGPSPEAGPVPEAGTDAFVPPVPTKGVTVTVLDGLAGKPDVRVILQDASGVVTGDQKTDATGTLTIAVAPSIVTVLALANTSAVPVSFFAVEDGDNLVVRLPQTALVGGAPIGHYAVTFTPPAAAPIPNATVNVGGNHCTASTVDTSAALDVPLFPECVGALNAVIADGSNVSGGRFGFAFLKGVMTPAAGTTSPVALPAWAPFTQTTLVVPLGGPPLSTVSADLYSIANGAAFLAPSLGGAVNDGGAMFATADGFADAYQSYVHADQVTGSASSSTAFVRREAVPVPANNTLPSFDFAAALPFITAGAVDSTTPQRPIVTLTSGALGAVDGGAVTLTWLDAGGAQVTWTFIVPASAAATFKVPALPADATAFVPLGTVLLDGAVFFEATQVPSYQETKRFPVSPRGSFDLLDPARPLPANGTLRITTLRPPPPA